MAFDFHALNEACIEEFGQALTFTPSLTGVPQSITGILNRGAGPEQSFPGSAPTLFLASDIDPTPLIGDEVSDGSSVFVFVDKDPDEIGGTLWQLRRDRDA